MGLLAPPDPSLRAVVDIGSNSLHLQLARVRDGAPLELLESARSSVRLGALVDGRVPESTQAAAAEALQEMVQRARARGCGQLRLAATAGLRDAQNGRAVASALSRQVGAPVDILSGREEARLTWLGARSRLGWERGLLIDMGGRSTELAAGAGPALIALESLPFGHLIAAQRSPEGDPAALHPLVDAALFDRAVVVRELAGMGLLSDQIALTAGTALTLARMAAIAEGAPPDVPRHGLRLSVDVLARAAERLAATPPAARAALPGFDPRRADTILPGCVMLVRLLRCLGARRVITCQAGLREGLLLDPVAASKTEGVPA